MTHLSPLYNTPPSMTISCLMLKYGLAGNGTGSLVDRPSTFDQINDCLHCRVFLGFLLNYLQLFVFHSI